MMGYKLISKKIGLQLLWGLVFFLFAACAKKEKTNSEAFSVSWKEGKPTILNIYHEYIPDDNIDSLEQWLQVRLRGSSTAILGRYSVEEKDLKFLPLIPFTRRLTYDVYWKNKLLGSVKIIPPEDEVLPRVVDIYPTNDTVPQNLLKIYIKFSKPMQEGKSADYISVIKNDKDTLPEVFLDLQPELWNNDRTILTLWLDPGRTKRDLQPNKQSGSPLMAGNRYEIVVKKEWPDQEGLGMYENHKKKFVAIDRDGHSPDPATWVITPPKAGDTWALRVVMHESMDYLLLKGALRIVDSNGNLIDGDIEVWPEEKVFQFFPNHNWKPGMYTLEIEPRLEDLAGNNLARLFDRDLTRDSTMKKEQLFKRTFHIN